MKIINSSLICGSKVCSKRMYSSSGAIITPSSSSSFTTHGHGHFNCKALASNSKIHSYSLLSTGKSSLTFNFLLFKLPSPKRNAFVSLSRPPLSTSISNRPLMEMQTCSVKMEVDVPISLAYRCYSDREAMPNWMPFISSVKVLEDKPDQSRWTLKYKAFGRDIEFSWLARNLQPIPNQKIHWRSLEGLPNSGAVRFYPRGPSSCLIELSVSYEVPQLLMPVASALQPFLESLLLRGLERFSKYAKSRQPESAN